jgi:predicted nucleic acid-binding protein
MGLSPLDGLPEGCLVTVDSAPIIYFLENHPRLAGRYAPFFDAEAEGRLRIAVSTITLAEVLTGPLRYDNELLAEQYRKALSGWEVVPVSEEIAVAAARFRATYQLRLPDAIQLATTVETGSVALITHDRDFSRVADISILS